MPAPAFPTPPPDVAAVPTNGTGQTVLLVLMLVGTAASLAGAAWLRLRYATWLPLLVVVGSFLSGLIEPICDLAVGIWYYRPGQVRMWTAFDNSFPVWAYLGFPVYYGGVAVALWFLVERGTSRRGMVAVLVPTVVLVGVSEIVMTRLVKTYTYYGPKAFPVAGYPAWVPLMVTSVILLEATGLARIRRSLPAGQRGLPAFALPAASVCLCLFFVPMTSILVTHLRSPSTALVYVAGVVSALSALTVWHFALLLMPAEGFPPISAPRSAAAASRGRPASPRPGRR